MILKTHFCKISLVLLVMGNWSLTHTRHIIDKRQIGVLARTGALPQGKRTTEFGLPADRNRLETQIEAFDFIIRELRKAENTATLKMESLLEEWIKPDALSEMPSATEKSASVPMEKKTTELTTGRSGGYLIKPSRKTHRKATDPFDPDDFLAEPQSTISPGYSPNAMVDNWPPNGCYSENPIRVSDFANDTLRSENEETLPTLYRNFYSKRNVASLARDGGFSNLKYPSLREQGWFDESDAVAVDDNRNGRYDDPGAGLKADSGKRKVSDDPRKKFNIFAEGNEARKRFEPSDLEWHVAGQENPAKKRFLGRIPQLGRTHQKVQAPPIRRRPHLRPNWAPKL